MDRDGGNGPKADLGTQDGPVSSRTNEPEDGNRALQMNPFLMPPVLRYVLKFVKTPELRGLRVISTLWDTMVVEEMEMRAWKGEYPDLEFEWNNYWKTLNADPMKNFENFFNQTTTCPNLFGSFKFEFPGAPLVLNLPKFTHFFESYSPRQVELALPSNFDFTVDANARNLLRGFVHRMAPSLVELTISKGGSIVDLPQIPGQESVERILFPKLEKVTLGHSVSNRRRNHYDKSVTSAFTTIFGQGICEMPSLKELEIFSVFGQLDDLLGITTVDPIRWRSLTSLEIKVCWSMNDDGEISKFVDGLMFLNRSGMALKKLSLAFKGEISHPVSGNLSQFLQSQSKFLETLSLNLSIHARGNENEDLDPETLPTIQLPLCHSLKSLDISAMYYRCIDEIAVYFELFGLISLANNFPILERLTLSSPCATTMALLKKTVDPAARRHLEVFEYCSLNWRNSEWTAEHNANLFNNFSTVGMINIH